jgi:hypothetical protein
MQRTTVEKPGYEAAKARALARLRHGYDLDWAPPASRDELHDRVSPGESQVVGSTFIR